MKHRTTPTLLAVAVVLLALNLAAALPWPTAQAQDEVQIWPPPPVKIIQISADGLSLGGGQTRYRLYRLWSDGTIEYTNQRCSAGPNSWCSWLVVPDP